VIGEGGSGGALAIGVADRVLMLQYATYSVISPEGCASILWKSADKASLAAETMGITADSLLKRGLIDEIVPEPLGSAHRDVDETSASLRSAISKALSALDRLSPEDLVEARNARLMQYGQFEEA
jgi:acetyl-CoA carboxylase carboxyl transferase subunit alpha